MAAGDMFAPELETLPRHRLAALQLERLQATLGQAYGYGLFTGGLGAHCGAERLGCTVMPVSAPKTGGDMNRSVAERPHTSKGDVRCGSNLMPMAGLGSSHWRWSFLAP